MVGRPQRKMRGDFARTGRARRKEGPHWYHECDDPLCAHMVNADRILVFVDLPESVSLSVAMCAPFRDREIGSATHCACVRGSSISRDTASMLLLLLSRRLSVRTLCGVCSRTRSLVQFSCSQLAALPFKSIARDQPHSVLVGLR